VQDVKLLDLSLKTFEPTQFVECQSNRRNDAAKVTHTAARYSLCRRRRVCCLAARG
jgi:hypothetical protein